MKLVNLSNEKEIAVNVNQAYTFMRRLKGLMFTAKLDLGTGMHIKPCQSVHTFFMNYSIDIIYLNAANIVVAIDEVLTPGRIGSRYADAVSVIELPAGTIEKSGTQIGNEVAFII